MTEIRITQQKDKRYFAEYINVGDATLNGIGQFGNSPLEAKINLEALLNAIRKEMNRTFIRDIRLN